MKNLYTEGAKHVSKIHINSLNSETCSLVCVSLVICVKVPPLRLYFPPVVYIGVCVCCEEDGEAAEEDEDSEEGAG